MNHFLLTRCLLVTAVGMSFFFPAPQATHAQSSAGLAAHWRFDEQSNGVASDASGNGYAGTLQNGPTWIGGKIGGAVRLDGVDDYVQVPSTLNLGNSDFTLEAWINGDPTMEAYGRIVDKGYASGFALGCTADRKQVLFEFLGGQYLTTTSVVIDNTWHHIAVVKAGGQATIYADGRPEKSIAVSAVSQSNTLPVFIGYNPGEGQRGHWKGAIDELRIYNRALSPAEIGAAAGTTAPPDQQTGGSFDGIWSTDLGYIGLVQNGASVQGYYWLDDWYPLLTGTVKGNVLEGTWDLSVASGSFRFTMTPDGRHFSGQATWDAVQIDFTGEYVSARSN